MTLTSGSFPNFARSHFGHASASATELDLHALHSAFGPSPSRSTRFVFGLQLRGARREQGVSFAEAPVQISGGGPAYSEIVNATDTDERVKTKPTNGFG